MSKKTFSNLKDIESFLVYTPPIFIVTLSIITMLITTFIINNKKENQIALKQLEYTHLKKESLNEYIVELNDKVSSIFDEKEKILNKSTSQIKGFIDLLSTQTNNKEDLYKHSFSYIKNIEKESNIDFVFIDLNTLKILKGEKTINYLQTLTNSKIDNQTFKENIIKNLLFISNENLQYWIDSDKREIQLSYFIKDEKNNLLFGAFSKVDDMKYILKNLIIDSIPIKSRINKFGYLWFYDYKNGYIYNFENTSFAKVYEGDEKQKHLQEYLSPKYTTYEFHKYKFLIGLNTYKTNVELENDIKKIELEFDLMATRAMALIIFISLILIASIVLFVKYISRVFARFNKRLEQRNLLYKKWKDRYELAIIASNDGLWDIDFNENKIYFSNKWLDMFGYGRNEINGFDEWLNLVHIEDRIRVEKEFEEHINGKSEHFISEYRIKDKTNRYKWILARGKIFKEEGNTNNNRMLMMSMDIDNNKRLSKELKYLDLLVEVGRIVIIRIKNYDNFQIEYLSNSIKSYGYEKTDLVFFEEFIYEYDYPLFLKSIEEAILDNKTSFGLTYRVVQKDKELKWVYSRFIILKDDNGNITHFYGYINDVTQMKLTQKELELQVERELEKNREKDRMLIAQNKLASMGEMIGSIAHQWRQPLNNINLLVHFIRDNYFNKKFSKESLDESINDIKIQIDYMSKTIDDFRNFYVSDKEKKFFNIKELIKKSLDILSMQLEQNGVKTLLDANEIILLSYENELGQVILNIINNAVDAAKVKIKTKRFIPIIEIKVSKENDNVIISIKNNCGKIDKPIIERIFEPYFTTKFEDKGTGIGLYMSKTIVEKSLNGNIYVKNTNDGVEFIIEIPLQRR